MNNNQQSFGFNAITRQMDQASAERRRRVKESWVERVLAFIEDERLITQAALNLKSKEVGIIFECNFAREVWDDPRVSFRVKQLANRHIKATLVDKEHTIAGKTFKRTQIHVTF